MSDVRRLTTVNGREHPDRSAHRGSAFAALAAAGCLWGTAFALGKWALADLSVGHMMLYRFLFASLGLAPAAWRGLRRPGSRIVPGDARIFLAAAVFGVPVQFLVQYAGLARTTVSHASLMVGALPVLLAGGAALFARERLGAIGWLGIAASTLGVALIAGAAASGPTSRGPTLLGDGMVVASLVAAVVWVLLSQRLMSGHGYSPVVVSAYVIIAGTVLLAAWVLATEGLPPTHISMQAWVSVVAQGLLATALTTFLWNWGLARVPASQAGVFANIEPVVGTMLGVLLFSDRLGPLTLLGGVLVIGAAVIVTRARTS